MTDDRPMLRTTVFFFFYHPYNVRTDILYFKIVFFEKRKPFPSEKNRRSLFMPCLTRKAIKYYIVHHEVISFLLSTST